MPRPRLLDTAYPSIVDFFESQHQRAFTEKKLRMLMQGQLAFWRVGRSMNAARVIAYLQEKGDIQEHTMQHVNDSTSIRIYSWRSDDEFTVISGLKGNSYFAYYTAFFLHQLTLQIPKRYYLNFEHSPTEASPHQSLSQAAIDKAFASPQRKSQLEYSWKGRKIRVTNGKYTGELGIVTQSGEKQLFHYTDLERTLIDASVRPAYTGGVFEVLEAYRRAKGRLDTDKLAHYLEELDYTYPYHQVIGFYLQKAGYPAKAFELFKKAHEHRFYLTYNLRNPLFSEEWSLYYPKGF